MLLSSAQSLSLFGSKFCSIKEDYAEELTVLLGWT